MRTTRLDRIAISVSDTEAYVVDVWQNWAEVTCRHDPAPRWEPMTRHLEIAAAPPFKCSYLGDGRYQILKPAQVVEAIGPRIEDLQANPPED